MSQLRAYCVGGAGINVGSAWYQSLKINPVSPVDFIGLDTSMNNVPDDNAFAVERPGETRGGGKLRTLNRDIIPGFVEEMLIRHKPGDFNIVIFSGGGATGSSMGPYIVRELMSRGIPVVSFVILDRSSDVEFKNTNDCMRSLDGQRKYFQMPVVMDVLENTENMTRGQSNTIAVERLNLLSIFMTDAHEEADFEDVQHLLNYSKVVDIPPAMTRLEFYDAETISQRIGKAVASFSLYQSRDEVKSTPIGKAYRVTGVMHPETRVPNHTGELHMVLEYDTISERILEDMKVVEESAVQRRSEFGTTRPKDLSAGADGDSMIW